MMRSWLALWLTALTTLTIVSAGCGGSSGDSAFPGGDDAGDLDGTIDGTTNNVPPDASFTEPDTGSDAAPAHCTPRTCALAGANCGPVADGCGGLIQCGNCTAPETCGGGGNPSVCGGNSGCTPKKCTDVGATCGPIGDGCGGVVQCGSCTGPQTCGGGGVGSQCGGNSGCIPLTACPAGQNCGITGDGCGGIVQCAAAGATCPAGQFCGGGGPNKCGGTGGGTTDGGADGGDGGGGGVDAGPICSPFTCSSLGATCGDQGDGCGGTLHCGTCAAPKTCGGGGVLNTCGGASACIPKTTCPAGQNCGSIADGCGGLVSCGNPTGCPNNQVCGGGGIANQCGGAATCVPKGCGSATCGPVADGCGGIVSTCGTCTAPAICGGGGVPSQCSTGSADGGALCQGLQCQQVTCDGGGTTAITGTVYDPAGKNPIYNALVYVPAFPANVAAFTPGVSCDQCGTGVTGTPLVSTVTGPDGKFTLTNVPVGNNVMVVVQLGRWRKKLANLTVPSCGTLALTKAQTSLPRNKGEGDIPQMAIATGGADPLECMLVKMGLDTTEFTVPTSNGRVHYYTNAHNYAGNGNENGIDLDPSVGGPAPPGEALWSTQSNLDKYDIVLLPCEGDSYNHNDDDTAVNKVGDTGRSNLLSYANIGGRLFFTHYSYAWAQPKWPGVANWDLNQTFLNSITGTIDTTFPKGNAFAQWLQIVNATTTFGQLPLNEARHDVDSEIAPTQRWVYNNASPSGNSKALLHMTYNTPTNATVNDAGVPNYCGRVVFSDFHVSAAALTNTTTFPGSCKLGDLSAQEKALEFMLFDLSNCIQQDSLPPVLPPTCSPRTCAQAGANCGRVADGCGGLTQSCGTCANNQTCGGGGVANQCGGCNPETCGQLGISCGLSGDGCGGVQSCGSCPPPQTCGGGGTPGQCGAPSCTPKTCNSQNIACGPAGDGCGHLLQCGDCPTGQTCGGGGTPGQCGAPDGGGLTCPPLTCLAQNIFCGPAGDGCGNQIDCGNCPPGQTCGGGGQQGVCGAPSCTPRTCAQANANCGPVADGCGGLLDCGTCPNGQSCGAGGTPNQCGTPQCTPRTCAQAAANCGPIGDGCGSTINCGTCTPPATCGGGGTASQCGGGIK